MGPDQTTLRYRIPCLKANNPGGLATQLPDQDVRPSDVGRSPALLPPYPSWSTGPGDVEAQPGDVVADCLKSLGGSTSPACLATTSEVDRLFLFDQLERHPLELGDELLQAVVGLRVGLQATGLFYRDGLGHRHARRLPGPGRVRAVQYGRVAAAPAPGALATCPALGDRPRQNGPDARELAQDLGQAVSSSLFHCPRHRQP